MTRCLMSQASKEVEKFQERALQKAQSQVKVLQQQLETLSENRGFRGHIRCLEEELNALGSAC